MNPYATFVAEHARLLREAKNHPLGGVRPRELWALVLFFSAISFLGFVARRLVGPGRGYLATGLLGGLPPVALITVLAVWFALIGVGMYASYPVKNALVSEQADAAYSGSLFGVIQTASAVGSASGPAVVGVLSDRWGVAAAFPAIAAASVLLALLFGLLFVGE